jgi:1-acyl-sn-glycerol-3-phosphate acyltransferase
MEESTRQKGIRKIDIREVISSKNPTLAKAIPSFLINYIKRIIHQDEINEILTLYADLKDAEFVEATLRFLKITYRAFGEENLPSSGRYIFVSNHPLGGLDGLVFINALSKHYSNLKFPVNDILTQLDNLSGIFLPVNKHGGQSRDAFRVLEETYASDSQILYFPAGLCSRKRRGVIKDLEWHKSFISKAIQYKRDIVPGFFSGRNSNFFYNLARLRTSVGIKANIEMVYLPDEMFSQKGKDITLVFGKPVPWQTFDNSKSSLEWADWMKSRCYELVSSIIH